mgnify:CR=1 FL=1
MLVLAIVTVIQQDFNLLTHLELPLSIRIELVDERNIQNV